MSNTIFNQVDSHLLSQYLSTIAVLYSVRVGTTKTLASSFLCVRGLYSPIEGGRKNLVTIVQEYKVEMIYVANNFIKVERACFGQLTTF